MEKNIFFWSIALKECKGIFRGWCLMGSIMNINNRFSPPLLPSFHVTWTLLSAEPSLCYKFTLTFLTRIIYFYIAASTRSATHSSSPRSCEAAAGQRRPPVVRWPACRRWPPTSCRPRLRMTGAPTARGCTRTPVTGCHHLEPWLAGGVVQLHLVWLCKCVPNFRKYAINLKKTQ